MAIPVIKMATIGLLPSFLKKAYYRSRGAKIGKNVSLGLLSIINSGDVIIEDNASISMLSFISARKVRIGKRAKLGMMVAVETGEFEIGNDSTIMEQVVIGGMLTPRSIIRIGKRVKIFPYCFINPTETIIIEDDVGIGGSNYIFTHGSWQSILEGFPVGFGPVTIKKGAWFPWRVFVLPNVTVGEYATIGAGSVINKDVPARTLAAGVPAKVLKQGDAYIKKYTDEEKSAMIIKILKEFAEFQQFQNGVGEVISESSDALTLGCKDYKVYYSYNSPLLTAPKSDVVISFKEMTEESKMKLQQSGISWFDIEGKKTFYNPVAQWVAVKDFFSRYGIRFEILS